MAERLVAVFKTYGYEGASLSLLADAVELSKASLYHHYPDGKAQIAAHALAYSGAYLQRLVLAPLGGTGDGRTRVRASFSGVAEYYGGEIPVCLMNSLLLGEGRQLFGTQIGAAVTAWRRALAKAGMDAGLDDAGAWSDECLERLQGALVFCRVEGGRAPLDQCLEKLKQI